MANRLQAPELIPYPRSGTEWPWLGFTFAGGRAVLGVNRARLKVESKPRGHTTNMQAKLGSIMLVAGGLSNEQIAHRPEIGVSTYCIVRYVAQARREFQVGQRCMLLPALLREQTISVEEEGSFSEFQPDSRALIMYGMIGRGVGRARVAAAFMLSSRSVDRVLASHAELEGGNRRIEAGIAAGLLTRQLGERSCVPLFYPNQTPEERGKPRPVVGVRQWNDLVQVRDTTAFVTAFEELGLDHYRSFSHKPANMALAV